MLGKVIFIEFKWKKTLPNFGKYLDWFSKEAKNYLNCMSL